jgi:hypothetical protein
MLSGILWWVIAISVVACLAYFPLRRVFRYCFPYLILDIPPNEKKNKYATWGRGLFYLIPMAVFGSAWK